MRRKGETRNSLDKDAVMLELQLFWNEKRTGGREVSMNNLTPRTEEWAKSRRSIKTTWIKTYTPISLLLAILCNSIPPPDSMCTMYTVDTSFTISVHRVLEPNLVKT